MNEINDLISKIINYIKVLYNKWLYNDEDDEISEPIDFLTYRKEIKVIDKSIQQSSNNSYWILALMIISGIGLYYYNPHLNLEEITKPVIHKIEDNIPSEFPTTFVAGTFIYKFITISINYLTGYKLNIFDDNNDDKGFNSTYNEDLERMINYKKGKSKYSPIDELNNEYKDDYKTYFPDEEDINTPKASTSDLPDIKSPPYVENPFNKLKFTSESNKSEEIKIEDWD